jgi:hypothetical protein
MESQAESFEGLPDDLARLAIQRLMASDCRSRAHSRLARRWQVVDGWLGGAAAVSASLAAVSFVQLSWLGIALAIAVAVIVPLQRQLGASGRSQRESTSATEFGALADAYERYLQLDLGPAWWRQDYRSADGLRRHLSSLDRKLAEIMAGSGHTEPETDEIAAAESRARFLLEYLEMSNVKLPPESFWLR